ncbi:MAG: (2Fe-2S)-binding protein, partial [Deltaproteobacteria bacterium]|nr:(2Fe-2S)-binding protein [Deltaproteobacteria bacterium]
MIKAIIDGRQVAVETGTTIYQAAKKLGIAIPTLCHSDMLEPYGVCRVCVVEIDQSGRQGVVSSCKHRIEKPIIVQTKSPRAQVARRQAISKLLARWPNVKVLRNLARQFSVPAPKAHPKQNLANNACILCGLCIRMCRDGVWHNILDFEGKGEDRRVVFIKPTEKCEGCGACAEICPSGAIKLVDEPNNPADSERIRRAGMVITEEMILLDHEQAHMREAGTGHLVEIMNDYDLLPVNNYQYGSHADAEKIASHHFKDKYFTQKVFDGCYLGCDMACAKVTDGFVLKTGPDQGKAVSVDGPEYETLGGCGSNLGIFDPEWVIEMNYYCDSYGIDTISFATSTAFVMECYEAGILNRQRTGGLELNFGAKDAAMQVLHQMASGEGFGLVVGQGVRRMKQIFAKKYDADPAFMQDIGMEVKGLEYSEYVCKESLAQQGGFGIALKGPQHDEAWLIFMDMVNKQIPTLEDKAEALHYFPMWRTWFGLNGLCKLPWNDVEPADNAETDEPQKVPKHVKGYCDFFAGMTGREVTPDDLILMSERVYNFQKIFNLRMGFGTRKNDAIPYRSAGPVTKAEYLSRAERYDKQLKTEIGLDPE